MVRFGDKEREAREICDGRRVCKQQADARGCRPRLRPRLFLLLALEGVGRRRRRRGGNDRVLVRPLLAGFEPQQRVRCRVGTVS